MRAAFVLVILLGAGAVRSASGRGLSARFGHVRAVEGEDLVVRVELEDPSCDSKVGACLFDSIRAVRVSVRSRGASAWNEALASPENDATWVATFTSTAAEKKGAGGAQGVLEIKAEIIGNRGGVLIEIGADDPLEIEVVSRQEALALDRALSAAMERTSEGERLSVIGYVGAEGRAGASARVRGLIGVGGRAGERLELVLYVSVGPAFLRPSSLESGGPLVLGFDAAARAYAIEPGAARAALFVEPFASIDLRLPGLDPGVGVRAGASLRLDEDISLDASLGGAIVLFRAVDARGSESLAGASGGVRVALRFGGRDETQP